MATQGIFPKFLTREVAERACNEALEWARTETDILKNYTGYWITILVPVMFEQSTGNSDDWLRTQFEPRCLYERKGGKNSPQYDFTKIARRKAMMLWNGQTDTGIVPHMLYLGDTRFIGAVKRQGIVGACSGFEDHEDMLLAERTVNNCIQFAAEAYERSQEKIHPSGFI